MYGIRAWLPRIMFAAFLMIAGGACQELAWAQPPGFKRIDLQQHPLSIPGRKVVQTRIDIDPGIAFPEHRHPGEEIIYVLEGSIEYRVRGRSPVLLEAGEVLFIPAGMIHSARNVGGRVGSELATYVVREGEPLIEIVD